MSETRQDIKKQLKYMKENKINYLSLLNPNHINLEEYNKRIKLLRDDLK